MKSPSQTRCTLPTAASSHDGWPAEIQQPHMHMIKEHIWTCFDCSGWVQDLHVDAQNADK